jgi:glucokinase
MVKNYLALDVGGTKVLGAIISDNKIIKQEKVKTNANKSQEEVYQIIKEVIVKLSKNTSKISGIGIGIPGRVDEFGNIVVSPNLPFENFALKENLQKDTGVSNILIGNDVNLGLLGEYWQGSAKGYTNVLGMFVGTGIGGAIIINKKLILGHQFIGGEIGHMKLTLTGPQCNCGAEGCLEAYSSKIAMQKYMESKGLKFDSILKSSFLKKGLAENNSIVKDAIKHSCYYIGEAIGSLVNCIDPDVVILGGGVFEAIGEYMLKKIETIANERAMTKPTIHLSTLGDNAVLFGAVKLLIDND